MPVGYLLQSLHRCIITNVHKDCPGCHQMSSGLHSELRSEDAEDLPPFAKDEKKGSMAFGYDDQRDEVEQRETYRVISRSGSAPTKKKEARIYDC